MKDQERISELARRMVASVDDAASPKDLKELAGSELRIRIDDNGKLHVTSHAVVSCW